MRKISLLIVSLVLVGLVGGPIGILSGSYGAKGALAQEIQEPVVLIPEALPELPAPGLKPGDFFYFLDMWGEAISEFFTFQAKARALLQTERALERIAEAKALLEAQGIDAPGLALAQEKIQQNMTKAATILEGQKARGIEVALLAKQLDKEFDARQALLKGVFNLAKENLKAQEKALKIQIREARLAGDFEKVGELGILLVNLRTQKDRINIRKDLLKEILETEEKRIKAGMEAKEKEVEALAEESEDLFSQREKDLERVLKQRERALEFQEKALEIQLRQAILDGDEALAEQIRAKLLDLEVQKKSLEVEENALEESLEQKRGKMKRAVAMQERAAGQIKEAREELLDVKEEMLELAEVPPAVSELIAKAESKLALAEQVFAEEKYGRAFGQAMAAEKLARNAGRILEKKGEKAEKLEELEKEIGETGLSEEALREAQRRLEQAPMGEKEGLRQKTEEARKRHQERLKKIERARELVDRAKERMPKTPKNNQERGKDCQKDKDCIGLICPMVIGGDTPQCNEEAGECFCGPSWTADNRIPESMPSPGASPKPTPSLELTPEPTPGVPRPDPARIRI